MFRKFLINCLCLAGLVFGGAVAASATELVTNGSFEAGTFAGWTVVNAAGSWNNWQNSPAGAGGTFVPLPVSTAPQHGTRVAWNGITASANGVYTMTQDITIPVGSTASMSWRDRLQFNLTGFCSTAAACGSGSYFVEILNTSNVTLQTLYSVTAPPLANTDTGWHVHVASLSSYAGQTIRLRFRDFATVTLAGPGQLEIDGVSVQSPALPTAASVSISGRVTDSTGQGIKATTVTISDQAGTTMSTTTNAFGYYRFDGIPVGETYVIALISKRYVFANSPLALNLDDETTGLDFVADP